MTTIIIIIGLVIALWLSLRRPTRKAGTSMATQSVPLSKDAGTLTLSSRTRTVATNYNIAVARTAEKGVGCDRTVLSSIGTQSSAQASTQASTQASRPGTTNRETQASLKKKRTQIMKLPKNYVSYWTGKVDYFEFC